LAAAEPTFWLEPPNPKSINTVVDSRFVLFALYVFISTIYRYQVETNL
jgi:hypothetical protein